MRRAALGSTLMAIWLALTCSPAPAQVAGEDPVAIPGDPLSMGLEPFHGRHFKPRPVRGQRVPRHPYMAPNGRSNLHDDAYQTDSYPQAGPLGPDIAASSALFTADCGSVTFD